MTTQPDIDPTTGLPDEGYVPEDEPEIDPEEGA
jgi:hypothetical protein